MDDDARHAFADMSLGTWSATCPVRQIVASDPFTVNVRLGVMTFAPPASTTYRT